MQFTKWVAVPAALTSLFFSAGASAQLIFSEYIEGSSNNKALEIYNASEHAVDLSEYSIQVFFNGAAVSGADIPLGGTLEPGAVYVLAHSSAVDSILTAADQLYAGGLFNGDDAVLLIGPGGVEDAIGQVGVDPGSQWGDSGLGTQNQTLIRIGDIVSGRTDAETVFDPAQEWASLGLDDYSSLGTHNGSHGGDDDDGTGEDSGSVAGACGDPATLISHIQGTTGASPLVGEYHQVEAVVVGVFQNVDDALGGFFLQEEDSDQDGHDSTSEGLFVYDNGFGVGVQPGDQVRVGGVVKEYYELTELASVDQVAVCAGGHSVTAVELSLPFDNISAAEKVEGMLVTLSDKLTVNDTHNLGRYGEVVLSSGRRYIPTHNSEPGAAALAQQAANTLNRLILDDGSSVQNPEIIPYPAPELNAGNSLRVGSTVENLRGVISYNFGAYRLHPVETPQFEHENARLRTPLLPGNGSLRVASFNVLNYFNGDGAGGGFPTARGATSEAEFLRQRKKIITALLQSGADIIGLMELENDGYAPGSAIADLVAGLNAAAGENLYAFVDPGLEQLGGDEIAVGLLYRIDKVSLEGAASTLDTYPFDSASHLNRQPLLQVFREQATGETLAVVVNHFKSKGSCPNDGGLNDDQNDGQSCWNLARTQAADALTSWLGGSVGNGRVLMLGDLNSYARENPITTLNTAGYTDLLAQVEGDSAYSYVYSGESGYLDYALANEALLPLVTGVTAWHINADEPRVLDYNVEFKTPAQLESLYAADAFRASDHDPVIVELDLAAGNQAPQASFTSHGRHRRIQFWDTSMDSDGEVVAWHWDFGDGATSSQRHPLHRYRKAGRYTVTLQVSDSSGQQAESTQIVSIRRNSGRWGR
ncbi:ExeM/NucH family extracellular endonuclease [Microbulbifer aggregans]|uniref:ExeM/NucH family extracellular endonuclease n=1 Tax=Microbulbifer aggregans TaxID=1769779 RepID=UPI001CFE559E|nr:ExeM/NucH family extracellular endonuclease [Microbulbifer aggregans]